MSFGEYYAGFSGLGKSFFDGMDSARQQRERDEYKANLAKLGDAAGSGDYEGAAKAAFGLGDINSGLGLLKYKQALAQGKAEAEAFGGLAGLYGPGAGGGADGGAQPPVGGVYGYPGSMPPGSQGGALPPLASARPPIFARQDLGAGDAGAPPDRGGVPVFSDMGGPSGDYLGGLFKRESNNNPNARAGTSSATGLGQFTTGTWNATARQHPDLNLTPVGAGQDGRTDANQMVRATQALTADNAGVLQGSSLPVNDASLYALHFLGAGGGRRFVAGAMRNPDAPASSYASADQVAANRNVFYRRDGTPKSAGEVMGDFGRSFGMGGGAPTAPAPAARPVQVASADPGFMPALLPPNGRQTAPAPALPPGASGLNPGMPPQAVPMPPARPADVSAAPAPDSPPVQVAQAAPPLQAPPLLSQTGAGPAAFPGAAPAPQATAADLPDSGSQDAGFVVPPAARAQLSAQAPQHLVQAGVPAPVAASVGNMAPGSGRKIQQLIRIGAMPGLSEGGRTVIGALLKNELEQTGLPDGVKEFVWARQQGMTQARSPAEYAAEKQAPQVVGPGSSVFQGGRLIATAPRETDFTLSAGQGRYTGDGRPIAAQPDRDKTTEAEKIEQGVAARRAAVVQQGLDPADARIRDFIISGSLPRDNQQQLTAGDRKAINEAEDHGLLLDQTIGTLSRAKELNRQTYTGLGARVLGKTGTSFPGAGMVLDPKTAAATREFGQIMSMEAIKSMSQTLKGATTDREMDRFMDILGDPSTPPDIRANTIDRMLTLAQRQKDLAQSRIGQMREGTYYRPGGGSSALGGARPSSGGAAPPASAVDYLRANPSLRDQFDAKYGRGAADGVLGGR